MFESPDRYDLTFVTEAHTVEPFFRDRVITEEERARVQDGVGFPLPEPVDVPASVISIRAEDGAVSSDQAGILPRDVSSHGRGQLLFDFLADALGRGVNGWTIDGFLQAASFEPSGAGSHGARAIAGYTASRGLDGMTTRFWLDAGSGRLRVIENGFLAQRAGPSYAPEVNAFTPVAEIVITYPDELSSELPNEMLRGEY